MAKFKNKKTGKVIEETLIYYIDKLKNSPNYIELKEDDKIVSEKEKTKDKTEIKE